MPASDVFKGFLSSSAAGCCEQSMSCKSAPFWLLAQPLLQRRMGRKLPCKLQSSRPFTHFYSFFWLWSTGLYSCLTTWITHFSKLCNPPNRSFLPILLWCVTMIVKNFANLRFQLWASACDQSRPPTCQISPAAGDGIKQLFIRQLLKPNQPIYQLSLCGCDISNIYINNRDPK